MVAIYLILTKYYCLIDLWIDTTVAGLIKELTDKTSFRDLINVQQELILGIESDKVLPQIEDLISNKSDLITVTSSQFTW